MSIKALPSMEHVFTVSIKGTDTGQVFDGTFRYKRPNIRKNAEISKTAAILNGGIAGLDEDTRLLHDICATLKHTLMEFPEWWEKSDFGYELHDSNVIFDIYKECMKFEGEWRDKVWASEDKKEDEKKEDKKAPKKG
jgi:hypothetical protein